MERKTHARRAQLVLLLAVCLLAVGSLSAQTAVLLHEGFESQSAVEAGGGTVYNGSFVPGLNGNGFQTNSQAEYITFPGYGHVNMTTGTADMYVYVDGSTLTGGARVDLLDFIGQPPWNDRILIVLYGYTPATRMMTGNVHFTSDMFLSGFPMDTNVGGSALFSANTWHRVTVTWAGLDGVAAPVAKYYIDDALVASHTGAAGSIMMSDIPAQFYVGRFLQDAVDPRPIAIIDELSISDEVLAPATLTGHVYRTGSSAPVVGASVGAAYGDPTAVTGSDGAYSITLLPGSHTLKVAASGYLPSETAITVTQAGPNTLNAYLTPEPIFDLSADLSTTVNPSGLWSYGYKASLTSTALTPYTSYQSSITAGPASPAPDVLNTSFETPVTADLYKGAIDGWYVYDRYGIGMDTSVMHAPGLATDGTQVGYAREGWFAQHWILAGGVWPATVAGNRYTLSADLGIDTVSPTQGLRPRTLSLCLYGTPDMSTWDFLAKKDLDLSTLTPGTMQHFSTSFDCTTANGNAGWSLWIGFDQTEANSLTLIDNVKLEIAPILDERIPAWMKSGDNFSGVGKNLTELGTGGTGTQPWIEPYMAYMFPGEGGQYATARWTSPAAGTVKISSLFTGQSPLGTSTDVHVVRNGASIYDGHVSGFNGTSPSFSDRSGATPSRAYSGQVSVALGDIIDFCVGYGTGGSVNDATGVSATIIPSTTQAGAITGTVTASVAGNPAVANAIVTVVGTNRKVTTAADGTYSLVVPAGSCALTVTKSGYDSQTQTTTVPTNGTAVLDFALMPHYNLSAMARALPYSDIVNVNGDLSEWSSAEFTPLDQIYNIDGSAAMWLNADIPEAYYAARWGANGQKLYVAIKVRDTSHYFTDAYTEWNARDAAEIYVHTTGTGPTNYNDSFVDAQHYVIGIKASEPDKVWTAMGYHDADIPGFLAKGAIDGQWLNYEAEITPYDHLEMDLETHVFSNLVPGTLAAGQTIGFDVVVAGCDSSGAYSGMKSANLMLAKFDDYSKFAQHLLVPGYTGVADAKNAPDGSAAAFTGVVTAAFDGYFYVESIDRTSGIRVSQANHGLTPGQAVTVAGYVHTLSTGERFVLAATVDANGAAEVAPLGMTNKAIGGGGAFGQQGVADAAGLNNIGLLVKTTGSVVSTQSGSFGIDDGSGLSVKVIGSVPPGATYVAVTGISSCEKSGGSLSRGIIATDVSAVSAP